MKFINSYTNLDTRIYHKQPPTPLKNPKSGHFNEIVANQIGWDKDTDLMQNWVEILSGNYLPKGFDPLAMAYAGHQFGHWAGQLGDGRGLLMAQVEGINGQITDLHLKGMGLTPYSRMGDGRAVLRSTIREYLCGHAMSSLGLSSSNALGFITSDTPVQRERLEKGAALLRVADTHIRLGHIEWIASFAPDLLPSFTKYMIETYYPELMISPTPILDFIDCVIKRTAKMIADWQLVGFAHGVMNTDNLSITGSTIDYGPFGFQERFDPAWINNHSDYTGRYAYQNQPGIGHWNLNVWMMHFMQLSGKKLFNNENSNFKPESITRDDLDNCLSKYETYFSRYYQLGLSAKLGLPCIPNNKKIEKSQKINIYGSSSNITLLNAESLSVENLNLQPNTLKLGFELLQIIEDNKLDYTNTFRSLIAVVEPNKHHHESELLALINSELDEAQLVRWQDWQREYIDHIDTTIEGSVSNPKTVGSKELVVEYLANNNPAYILRNAMAQRAIDKGELQDFSEVDRLFKLLKNPYTTQDIATKDDITPPNKDDKPIIVSCSS